MHKWVARTRMCMQHLLPVMLPGVPIASSFLSAHFPLHAPLTPSAFLVASASSASSLSSALPVSSALSTPLLCTNLARIYHHRECCLSACPTILEPSQWKKAPILSKILSVAFLAS